MEIEKSRVFRVTYMGYKFPHHGDGGYGVHVRGGIPSQFVLWDSDLDTVIPKDLTGDPELKIRECESYPRKVAEVVKRIEDKRQKRLAQIS